MKKIWDLDLFDLTGFDDSFGVITVRDGVAVLNLNGQQFLLEDMALVRSDDNLKTSLFDRLQAFNFRKGAEADLDCKINIMVTPQGPYLVICTVKKMCSLNDHDPRAKNDVIILKVGDAMEDLMNATGGTDEG